MYVPTAFREDRLEVLWPFLRANGFATVVSHGNDGLIASHLPVLLDETRGKYGVLRSHVARANSHWRQMGSEALVIFHGPHAYVSPRWYESNPAVPTWNYAIVHAYGTPRVVEDLGETKAILAATVRQYEGEGGWSMDAVTPEWVNGHVRGVVAFEIEITRLEGKFKLGQNRSVADREGAIARLNEGGEVEREVARMMGASVRGDR